MAAQYVAAAALAGFRLLLITTFGTVPAVMFHVMGRFLTGSHITGVNRQRRNAERKHHHQDNQSHDPSKSALHTFVLSIPRSKELPVDPEIIPSSALAEIDLVQ